VPLQSINKIPNGEDVFVDANILVYALNEQSAQCKRLLERCIREEVTGICLFEIVNEATHRLMIAEARSKGLISKEQASHLRQNCAVIGQLSDYWTQTETILNLNFLFLSTDESIVRGAQAERSAAGLLTNDSMIVSCMRNLGISSLATADSDFERAHGIVVYKPDDLPKGQGSI
jgi:predicted nucleic acid-binding protein